MRKNKKNEKVDSVEGAPSPKERIEVVRNYQTPSYHATRVESRIGRGDVCMQFMEMIDVKDETVVVRHVASVWLTIAHYKATYEMMGRQIAKYEEMFGPIPKNE